MKHLNGLIEFFSVIESGGFTKAADTLGVSTSYVSRKVSDLEERLQVRLLHRSTRKVSLTALGQLYYENISLILSDIESLESKMNEQQQQVVGKIRVTAGGLYGESTVSQALAKFAKQHPKVSLHMSITDRRIDIIQEGYDLAIRHGPPDEPDLVARPVATRNFIACAAPSLIESVGIPTEPNDLLNLPCIGATRWKFRNTNQSITIKVASRWESNNGTALAIAAAEGVGFVQLAATYVQPYIDEGELVPVLTEYQDFSQKTYLVYPTRKLMPYRLRALIDFLVENL